MFNNQGGIQALLKEGARHISGLDEALLRNIEAASQIGQMTKACLGPCGLNKLVINHLEKQTVTRDAAKMFEELEVVHPAAKLVSMAAQAQHAECGDGTNVVSVLAGELLGNAGLLMAKGVHATEIIKGYEIGLAKSLEILDRMEDLKVANLHDRASWTKVVASVLGTKLYDHVDFVADLVSTACVAVMPKSPSDFDPESVRVVTLAGSGNFALSKVVDGVVLNRDVLGSHKRKTNAKAAVFSIGLEMTGTEQTSTVLLTSAEELMNFSKGEQQKAEDYVKGMADLGVQVVVSGGSVSDIFLHYLNLHGIMVIKCTSKFELKRISDTLGAVQIARLGVPLLEELGFADSVEVTELSSAKVTVIRASSSRINTILLRGATNELLVEVERAIGDALQLIRCVAVKNERAFCYGGGCAEMRMAKEVRHVASKTEGLEQYGIGKYADALESIPKSIAANAGLDAEESLAFLRAQHVAGKSNSCIDVFAPAKNRTKAVVDAPTLSIFDHVISKKWALRLATDAVMTVLRIQHIIVARQAGGPKPRGEPNVDDD